MEISIRTVETNDYEAIYHLIMNELGYSELDLEHTGKRIDAMRSRTDYQTFVAEYDKEVIGFIGLLKYIAFNIDGEYLQITALAVSREFQNLGVGTRLVEAAEAYARKENIRAIELDSRFHRVKAHAFYEHRGYEKLAYTFEKELTNE